jgi:hypothetical protein
MKTTQAFLSWAVAAALLGSPFSTARSASWEDEKKVWEEYANTPRGKDPGYAAKLSLNFLPIDNGHFYVGEVGKGIWFSVAETAALAAVAIPVLGAQSRSKQDIRPVWTDAMVVSAAAGGVAYMALKVWSAFDAAEGARRYNERMKADKSGDKTWNWRLTPAGVALTRRWPSRE